LPAADGDRVARNDSREKDMAAERQPLPPGRSERQFSGIVKRFEAALGAEAVVTAPSALAEFYDPYNLPTRTDFKPSAALFPTSVEQIQEILRIANADRNPLSAVSQGGHPHLAGRRQPLAPESRARD